MLTIRPVTYDDLAELHALLRGCYNQEFARDYSPEVLALFLDRMSTIETALVNSGTYFIAQQGDRIVGGGGWAHLTPLGTPDAPDLANVRKLATHIDAMGTGVGRALMAHIHGSARSAGKTWMHCLSSIGAAEFYETLGYRRTGSAQFPSADPALSYEAIEMRMDL